MINLILQSVAVGVIAYGVSHMFVNDSGPFDLFNRFKIWLLPIELQVNKPLSDYAKLDESAELSQNIFNVQAAIIQQVILIDSFKRSFKGTVFGLVACEYCLGVWVAAFATLLMIPTIGLLLSHSPIVWLLGIGVQRIIKAIGA